MIATHLETAAKHHESDNHEKEALSTVKSQGHFALANEAQREDVKNHAIKG